MPLRAVQPRTATARWILPIGSHSPTASHPRTCRRRVRAVPPLTHLDDGLTRRTLLSLPPSVHRWTPPTIAQPRRFRDAIDARQLDLATAVDGLRPWQRFLDQHLHAAPNPSHTWTDFPPQRLRDLAAIPSPLGHLRPRRAPRGRPRRRRDPRATRRRARARLGRPVPVRTERISATGSASRTGPESLNPRGPSVK